jgi:hypothetical protein
LEFRTSANSIAGKDAKSLLIHCWRISSNLPASKFVPKILELWQQNHHLGKIIQNAVNILQRSFDRRIEELLEVAMIFILS